MVQIYKENLKNKKSFQVFLHGNFLAALNNIYIIRKQGLSLKFAGQPLFANLCNKSYFCGCSQIVKA